MEGSVKIRSTHRSGGRHRVAAVTAGKVTGALSRLRGCICVLFNVSLSSQKALGSISMTATKKKLGELLSRNRSTTNYLRIHR